MHKSSAASPPAFIWTKWRIIRPDCVALGLPPRRTDQYACGVGYPLAGHAPCQTGACFTSLRWRRRRFV